MPKYRIDLTEAQLRVVNAALEEFFRLPMNQWGDLSDRLAFKGFPPGNEEARERAFDCCIAKRDAVRLSLRPQEKSCGGTKFRPRMISS